MGGKGESVWLGWFLCDVLNRFAGVCDLRGETEKAKGYRSQAQEYAASIERSAWDGAWYRRAYFDDGTPLGSNTGSGMPDRCHRPVLVRDQRGGGPQTQPPGDAVSPGKARFPRGQAIRFFSRRLLNNTEKDPGYIKGYLPGTRENGGQYTHAAIWTAWAFARLGDGKQAGELFDLLNPIYLIGFNGESQRIPGGALRDVRGYLQQAALHAPGRMDLVYRISRLDVPAGADNPAWVQKGWQYAAY